MLFNSLEFLVFLPLVFAGYWLLARSLKLQNLFVVVASYVFYGWWDWRFLLLISFTSVWAWASGLAIECFGKGVDASAPRTKEKWVVAGALIVNLGILGVFKYYNFFLDNAVALLNAIGFQPHPSSLKIILPVGISFYTFQALSYVIDVYRKDIKPTRDLVAFLAFVSFFPQLVAGPIERATNLLPQFLVPRRFDYLSAVDGCRQMLWGAFKKVVLADTCAERVDQIFGQADSLGCGALWLGALLFAFQIYGDFSGYSDIAIGCSRLFGIRLKRNFAFPYFSRDVAEFWRRWHMSLTTWFRDYIYIPLGGSRCGTWKKIRNTFVIFLVSGFWHGANWTFIAWGLFHACLFVPLMISGQNRKYLGDVAEGRILPSVREFVSMTITFIFVICAWVLFRSQTIGESVRYLSSMFNFTRLWGGQLQFLFPLEWVGIVVAVEWVQRKYQHGLQRLPEGSVWLIVRWMIYFLLVSLIIAHFKRNAAFIYFQF